MAAKFSSTLPPKVLDKVHHALAGKSPATPGTTTWGYTLTPAGTRVPAGGAAPRPAPAAAAPAPAATARQPVAPFLTPAQQAALDQYDATYARNRASNVQKYSDAVFTTNADLAAAKHTHDVNTDMANQTTAARGIFQSSIHDADLNDLDVTLLTRNNNLNTNLNRLYTDTYGIGGAIPTMDANYAVQHNAYNDLAMANAQAQPPSVTPPAPVTPLSTGAPAPAGGFHGVPGDAQRPTPAPGFHGVPGDAARAPSQVHAGSPNPHIPTIGSGWGQAPNPDAQAAKAPVKGGYNGGA